MGLTLNTLEEMRMSYFIPFFLMGYSYWTVNVALCVSGCHQYVL